MGCIAVAFGLAHVSTYGLERPLTELGRRWAKRLERKDETVREAA
jgi:peptidoglycan/LPS O-acetylase OafA/YrhL